MTAKDDELVTDEIARRWWHESRYPTALSPEANAKIILLLRERAILKQKLLAAGGSHPESSLVSN